MKISDKLVRADDRFDIHVYDNGFMIEVSGQNSNDEWSSAKVMANTLDELLDLVKEAVELPRS